MVVYMKYICIFVTETKTNRHDNFRKIKKRTKKHKASLLN